jgi:hypothetical protein
LIPPAPPEPAWVQLLGALWLGLYGIPAGLGMWLAYRAIRFAVRG